MRHQNQQLRTILAQSYRSQGANLKSGDSDAAVIEVSDYMTGSYLLESASSDPVVSGRPAAVVDGSILPSINCKIGLRMFIEIQPSLRTLAPRTRWRAVHWTRQVAETRMGW